MRALSDATDILCAGGLEVRVRERSVAVHGVNVALSSREFSILRMLAEHPGWVLSSTQLAGDPDEGDYSPESVSVLVSRIRHKLAAAGADDAVETVRGAGYRLRVDEPCEAHPEVVRAGSELKDASWRLQEAVIEAGHSGTAEQQGAVAEALEQARRAIFAALAE